MSFSKGDRVRVIAYANVSPEAADGIIGATGTVKSFLDTTEGTFVNVYMDEEVDEINIGLGWVLYPHELEII